MLVFFPNLNDDLNVCEQMGKSVTNVQELGPLANCLTRDYNNLATETCRIVFASTSPQVSVSSVSLFKKKTI